MGKRSKRSKKGTTENGNVTAGANGANESINNTSATISEGDSSNASQTAADIDIVVPKAALMLMMMIIGLLMYLRKQYVHVCRI